MKWRGMSEAEATVPKSTLAEELAERKRLANLYVPAETRAINERAIEELRASGIADRVLRVGSSGPEFTLQDQDGKPARSADLLARSPLVVSFLRGRWCPFCCGEVEALNRASSEIRSCGGSLLGISPQTAHQSYLMHNQHRLEFPLLSDPGNQVARQFGIVYRVPDYQQKLFSSVFINLPHVNGDTSWELPIPATFVLGPDNVIRYAFADPDYTRRAEPGDLVASIRGLAAASSPP